LQGRSSPRYSIKFRKRRGVLSKRPVRLKLRKGVSKKTKTELSSGGEGRNASTYGTPFTKNWWYQGRKGKAWSTRKDRKGGEKGKPRKCSNRNRVTVKGQRKRSKRVWGTEGA